MDTNDPCGDDNRIPTEPAWPEFPSIYSDVKFLRDYKIGVAGHYELYFCRLEPTRRPMIALRFGEEDNNIQLRGADDIRNPSDSLEIQEAFATGLACAQFRKYLP